MSCADLYSILILQDGVMRRFLLPLSESQRQMLVHAMEDLLMYSHISMAVPVRGYNLFNLGPLLSGPPSSPARLVENLLGEEPSLLAHPQTQALKAKALEWESMISSGAACSIVDACSLVEHPLERDYLDRTLAQLPAGKAAELARCLQQIWQEPFLHWDVAEIHTPPDFNWMPEAERMAEFLNQLSPETTAAQLLMQWLRPARHLEALEQSAVARPTIKPRL